MCGVAGILNPRFSPEHNQSILTRMLSRISHRGPDESGIYLGNGIGLGSVRLSIIDLATGQQPMHTPDRKLWIVFNGEIFNYKELKEELLLEGYTFHTTSDTEVLLYLFKEYGERCLQKLNGQFVFAVWNNDTQELFIARDRLGIRPLFYYHHHQGAFVFASEIKSILEYPDFTPEINTQALSQIFTFWTSLSPNTIFNNVRELSPGHYLKIKNNRLDIFSYWNINFGILKTTASFDEALEQFGYLLNDAVRIRMRADVPVAAYLSGGLDSSATTAIIKTIVPDQLQTFSIGFSDSEFDETSYQQEVASQLQTKHNAFYCTSPDIARAFPSVIWHSEIPLLRTAPAPMFLLSAKVRKQNIKVVITGEGADEMLAGYDIFKETLIRQFWMRQPHSQFRPLLFKKLYPYIPQISSMNANMMKFVFGYKLDQVSSPFYSHLLRWHNTGSTQKYFNGQMRRALDGYSPEADLASALPHGFSSWSSLEKAQWLETSVFLSGYLLSSQGDRMGMANSVEGRYPFLDYRLVEFCASLPDNYKIRGLNEKYMLKKLMAHRLPLSVLKRPKQAYRAPVISTFITNPPDYLNDIVSEEAIKRNGIFVPAEVSMLFKKAREGGKISEIDAMAITGIISTQLFAEIFIHNNPAFKPRLQLLVPTVNYQSNPVFYE